MYQARCIRCMNKITIRDLRNEGDQVVERVMHGEQLTITRDGRAVAELHPVVREPLDSKTLLARWRMLPRIDAAAMRKEMDDILDPTL